MLQAKQLTSKAVPTWERLLCIGSSVIFLLVWSSSMLVIFANATAGASKIEAS